MPLAVGQSVIGSFRFLFVLESSANFLVFVVHPGFPLLIDSSAKHPVDGRLHSAVVLSMHAAEVRAPDSQQTAYEVGLRPTLRCVYRLRFTDAALGVHAVPDTRIAVCCDWTVLLNALVSGLEFD